MTSSPHRHQPFHLPHSSPPPGSQAPPKRLRLGRLAQFWAKARRAVKRRFALVVAALALLALVPTAAGAVAHTILGGPAGSGTPMASSAHTSWGYLFSDPRIPQGYSWMGAIRPPDGVEPDTLAFCIDMGLPAPFNPATGATAQLVSVTTTTDEASRRMAYIIDSFGTREPGEDAATTMAAISYLAGLHLDSAASADILREITPQFVVDRANGMWEESGRLAGNYAAGAIVSTYSHPQSYRSGQVSQVGVQVEAAQGSIWLEGINFTLTLEGPARWINLPEGYTSSQEGRAVHGVTASAPLTFTWQATGTGQVTIATDYDNSALPANELEQMDAGAGVQTTVRIPPRQAEIVGQSQSISVQAVLQHTFDLTTAVPAASQNIAVGDNFADTVTLAPASDVAGGGAHDAQTWLSVDGTPLLVPIIAETFGPFSHQGAAVPEGMAPVATVRFTHDAQGRAINSFGSYVIPFDGSHGAQVTGQVSAPNSGWYFHRVSVDGARLRDGSPDMARTLAYLREDHSNPTGTDLSLTGPGRHGDWQASQVQMARMDVVVTTQVDQSIMDESQLPAPLIDHITLSLARPDDMWIHTGPPGSVSPALVEVEAQAWGPFTQPQATVANPDPSQRFTPGPSLLANLHGQPARNVTPGGAEIVCFTGPGTQSTGGLTVISPQTDPRQQPDAAAGFYTWTEYVRPSSYVNGAGSDFWVGAETASIRQEIIKWSQVFDHSVNPGGLLRDSVTVGGFPVDQGQFTGLMHLDGSSWMADNAQMRLVVYGPLAAPPQEGWTIDRAELDAEGLWSTGSGMWNSGLLTDDSGQVIADAGDTPIHDVVQFTAQNTPTVVINPVTGESRAVIEFGLYPFLIRPVPLDAPVDSSGQAMEQGWYVFVVEFDGDHRSAPFSSDFADQRQRSQVTWPSLPQVPVVPQEPEPPVEPEEPQEPEFPRIDIEKSHTAPIGPGMGMFEDQADNLNGLQATEHGDLMGLDADTQATALLMATDSTADIYFTISNIGSEALTNIVVTDSTFVGDHTVELTCPYPIRAADGVFMAAASSADADADVHTGAEVDADSDGEPDAGREADVRALGASVGIGYDVTSAGAHAALEALDSPADGAPLVLQAGESFICTGRLTAPDADTYHANMARVHAVGINSGSIVGDDDPFWAYTPPQPPATQPPATQPPPVQPPPTQAVVELPAQEPVSPQKPLPDVEQAPVEPPQPTPSPQLPSTGIALGGLAGAAATTALGVSLVQPKRGRKARPRHGASATGHRART